MKTPTMFRGAVIRLLSPFVNSASLRLGQRALILFAFTLVGAVAAPTAVGAAYEGFVGCGTAAETAPAHVCHVGDELGAFFKSESTDATYEVCVSFPTNQTLCQGNQIALAGTRYVNTITSSGIGYYEATWNLEGSQVIAWPFRVVAKQAKHIYFLDRPGYVRRMPRTIRVWHGVIRSLSGWQRWDSGRTKAHGIFAYNNCSPDCALGRITKIPVRVVLSEPDACGHLTAYRRLEYVLAQNPPRGRRRARVNFGFAC